MKLTTLWRFALVFSLTASMFLTSVPAVGHAQTAAVGAKPSEASSYAPALQKIEGKLEARRKELGIPGISLVVVKDGEVIYMKGLGYKDFEKQVPVTADTQFAIGSATKAFTALTALMAQDEGKLSLDDSPKKYLPYFHMYDPETDKAITVRDLLSHSSGLNRTDLAMVTGRLNRAELIEVAAQAKPTAKLREKFQYQNIMFVAAGEVAAAAEKSSWDKLIADRVFKPLGMTNSTRSIADMEKAKDFSFGYDYNFDTKETRRLPFRDIVEVAPAGSINSSARDMAQWLKFVLAGGVAADGKRLVSEKGFDEWTRPQMKIAGKSSYGLGWFIQDWNGNKIVQHGGNIDGFNSLVAMMPEKKLGFVLLTNVSASSLGSDLMPIVWQNILGESKPAGPVAAPATTNSGAAKELIGSYSTPSGNGTVEIRESAGAVTFNIPGQQPYALGEKAKDSYAMSPLPEAYSLKAKRDAAGKIVSVVVAQPEGEFEFKRKDESAVPAKPAIGADELMQKALDAVGGEAAWRKFTTRVTEVDVDLENQGIKATATLYNKAPNKAATETVFTAVGKKIATGFEYFDGTVGEEIYSFAPAEKYTGKRLEDARLGADFYGSLNWKTNFKKIDVAGTAKVGDEEAYVVSFESEKGTPYKEYYSTKTFLLLKREGVVSSSTSSIQIPYTTTFSDYRDVDGIKLPFRSVNVSISNGNIVQTIKSVKHNVPVDDRLFAPRKVN